MSNMLYSLLSYYKVIIFLLMSDQCLTIDIMLVRVKGLLSRWVNLLYSFVKSKGDMIVLNAWINLEFGRIEKRNFGDELSYYLLRELTGKMIVGYHNISHCFNPQDLLFIGSLLEDFTTPNSIVWGSGAICGNKPLKNKPARVCAVRGKLTRQYLIEQGVECPEVYGDPALLLPVVYKPQVKKRYKIGLIPHVIDLQNPLFLRLLELNENVKLISFANYEDWHSVIDQINECEFIISSSLHGLIISDAYHIPNLWVRVSDGIIGGNFKYHDYFTGVGRAIVEPIILDEDITLEFLLEKKGEYKPIQFNLKSFLEASPIRINSLYHD